MINTTEIFIRLALACFLGGVIGLERERNKQPAGIRTHILVCVGATLVMLCNIFIFEKYKYVANIDPARLGAQVISGIGFLGAGTIIKEGLSIRGLTTAASLWVVACMGIAIGLGFYTGAVITTFFILIILIFFSKFEYLFNIKTSKVMMILRSVNTDGQIDIIQKKLKEFEIVHNSLSVESAKDNLIEIKVSLTKSKDISNNRLIEEIYKLEGIKFVQIRE